MPDTTRNRKRLALARRLAEAQGRVRKLVGACALLAVTLVGPGCASGTAPWVAHRTPAPTGDLIARVPHAQTSAAGIELTAGESSVPVAKSTAPGEPEIGFSSPAMPSESEQAKMRLAAAFETRTSPPRRGSPDGPAPIPPRQGAVRSQAPTSASKAPAKAGPLEPFTTVVPRFTASLAAIRPTVVSAARARQQAATQWAQEKATVPPVRQALPPAPAAPAAPAEAAPKALAKAEVKAEVKQPELKTEPTPEVKTAEVRPQVKTEARTEATPEVKTAQAKPEVKTAEPKPEVKTAEAKPQVKPETKTEAKAEPKAPDRQLASRPLRAPALVKTASPKTLPERTANEITPVGETPERTVPPEHDNRLAVNDRLGGRFPTHLPRPRLSQPLASAAQVWKSELREDAHRHLTESQRETEGELAVAPVPRPSADLLAQARPDEARVQRTPSTRIEQPVAEQAPRHAVVPPTADPPATRPVHDAAAPWLRFADRHATRPPAAKNPRPSEFVSALAAQRQAEMAAAVKPLVDPAPSSETHMDPRVARAEAQSRPTILPDKTPKEALAPTMPLPSPAEGAPVTILERLPAPQVDKNSAYVRAIADWANESYAGVRNYRTEMYHVTASEGPLANRDGVMFRFRKAPLAIHAGWGTDPHQGRQWLFAEGHHSDKWFVLEPVASGRMKVLVEQDSLPLGNGNRPVTEWGLGSVISRFERHMSLAAEGIGRCLYEGVVRRPELEGTLHEVVYHPTGNGCCVHYYFSTTNLLPRLVELKLDGEVREAEIFKRLEVNLLDLDRPTAFEASELFKN